MSKTPKVIAARLWRSRPPVPSGEPSRAEPRNEWPPRKLGRLALVAPTGSFRREGPNQLSKQEYEMLAGKSLTMIAAAIGAKGGCDSIYCMAKVVSANICDARAAKRAFDIGVRGKKRLASQTLSE